MMGRSGITVAGPSSTLRKAAILVLALGNDLARDLFPRLSEDEIKVLADAAASLGAVTSEEVVRVLFEFRDAFHGRTIPEHGGGPLFQGMVERALGEERARDLLAERSSGDPFEACTRVDPEVLAQLLLAEHPQTGAIVLASLDRAQAGRVLAHLGPDRSSEVVYRMAHLGTISDDVRYDIGATLLDQLRAMGTLEAGRRLDGKKLAAEVTKSLPAELSDQLLARLEESHSAFATDLRASLFVFDDLARVDSRTMQRLLREIDSRLLMVALKGAPEEISSAIYSAMSSRAAEMLREDMAAAPPVRIADVQNAQAEILDVAFRLEAEGLIALPRGGAGEVV